MEIRDKLRQRRKLRDLTLKEVSKNTGISLPFLSDIERGNANPSLTTLGKLANFYNISISELIKLENKNTIELTDEELEWLENVAMSLEIAYDSMKETGWTKELWENTRKEHKIVKSILSKLNKEDGK